MVYEKTDYLLWTQFYSCNHREASISDGAFGSVLFSWDYQDYIILLLSLYGITCSFKEFHNFTMEIKSGC